MDGGGRDGWMDGWMDRWMDGWTKVWISADIRLNKRMYVGAVQINTLCANMQFSSEKLMHASMRVKTYCIH